MRLIPMDHGVSCLECLGTGYVCEEIGQCNSVYVDCPICEGTGYVSTPRKDSIKLQATSATIPYSEDTTPFLTLKISE
jgi:hypothetical protein